MTITHNTMQSRQKEAASSDGARLQRRHQLRAGTSSINRARQTNQPETKHYPRLTQPKNNSDAVRYDSKCPTGNNGACCVPQRCPILRERASPLSGDEPQGWAPSAAEPPALLLPEAQAAGQGQLSRYLPCLRPCVSQLSAHIYTWLCAIKLPLNT